MTELKTAHGATISVELVIQRVELPDGSTAMVAIARDIRERIEVQVRLQRLAQSEHSRAAELNAVIRAMGEGVIVCAADGMISLANPAAERLFPDVAGQSYEDILGQLDDPDRLAPRPGGPARPGRAPDAGGSGPLGRDHLLSGQCRDRPGDRRRGDDRPRPRHHRGPPPRGRPGDVHRRPVARAAHAGDDDLRRRQAARPRAIDARRGHPPRDLPGHLRGGGAAPAAGRGRRRPQPVRRGGRRDRLGAGPAPATGAPRRRIGGGALAGRVVRARHRAGAADGHGRSRPTSSRSSATSSPTRPSTAGPARP